MRNVVMAVFAAVGLSLAATPSALAGDRPTTRPSYITSYMYSSNATHSSSARASAVAQPRAEAGNMERKCVVMSCGTPWCYTVKR